MMLSCEKRFTEQIINEAAKISFKVRNFYKGNEENYGTISAIVEHSTAYRSWLQNKLKLQPRLIMKFLGVPGDLLTLL